MELVQVGKNTFYLDNPTNIGIYLVNNKDVYLIDSGNNKDAGKKILKIINEHNCSTACKVFLFLISFNLQAPPETT